MPASTLNSSKLATSPLLTMSLSTVIAVSARVHHHPYAALGCAAPWHCSTNLLNTCRVEQVSFQILVPCVFDIWLSGLRSEPTSLELQRAAFVAEGRARLMRPCSYPIERCNIPWWTAVDCSACYDSFLLLMRQDYEID
jgi:hypothetical protein